MSVQTSIRSLPRDLGAVALPSTRALLVRAAEALGSRPELWQPLVRFDADERYFTRIPQRLAIPGGFEAWLLTWLPGQGTGWHDHGGSAGAVAVVSGTLAEYLLMGSEVAPLERGDLRPGQVRAFGAQHRHEMVNSAPSPPSASTCTPPSSPR
jgi:hypothetical protein